MPVQRRVGLQPREPDPRFGHCVLDLLTDPAILDRTLRHLELPAEPPLPFECYGVAYRDPVAVRIGSARSSETRALHLSGGKSLP